MLNTKNNRTNTLVGCIMVGIGLFLIALLIWFSASDPKSKFKTYIIYMQEAVGGLDTDSPVQYNGVLVGKVQAIKINPANPQIIELSLSINKDVKITRGTKGTLSTTSMVTGIVYVSLQDSGQNTEPLRALPGQTYPVINSSPSLYLRLDTALTQISNEFSKISEPMRALFNPDMLETIKETFYSSSQIYSLVQNDQAKLHLASGNLAVTSQIWRTFYQSNINQEIKLQLLPVVYRIQSQFNAVIDNLTDLRKEIKDKPTLLIFKAKNNHLP